MAVQETRWGRAGKQLKVCAFNTRHPRTGPRDNREPHSPPALPTSLQVCKGKMPSPAPLLWPPSWEHISLRGIPKLPALWAPSLLKGTVLGQAMEKKRGLGSFPGRVA